MDSKGLKRPVSESDEMEASVLGCRFSDKAEHLPIKKRRFLFRDSSPPLNTASSKETENVSTVTEASATGEFKANNVKLENTSVNELKVSAMDCSTLDKATADEPTLDNSSSHVSSESECSKMIQVTSSIESGIHEDDKAKVKRVITNNGITLDERSEVDNVDELSFGYDSQFEDGEFRESSIQTWEGSEGEDITGAFESQKGADEISSLILPEKLDSSDRVSGSEPNEAENGITEVNMKDKSQTDQWKMNVSGSDLLPEELETKGERSRFYKREPLSATRDAFLSRVRFRMQGCSSSKADDSASRSARDSGVPRTLKRVGKYIPAGNRGGDTLHRSFSGPSNLTNEVNIDPNATRQSFRTRSMADREEDEFRARLGLRPSGDTCHNRFVNVDRVRPLRYDSRHNDPSPRGRYHGPETDDYNDPSMEFSHSFPPKRMITRSRTRSPVLRPDTRIRRPRSPNYRHGFDPNYKQRSSFFDRSPPPPPPPRITERLSFYDSSRKTKQNESYRVRFSEVHGGDVTGHGYRQGGFVRRYETGRPVKHIQYDEEAGYGSEGLEYHGRNPKPHGNGTDARFHDHPRRVGDERENW